MGLAKRYDPQEAEPRQAAFWQASSIYHFEPDSNRPIYSIDTPPPTVSGNLHLGHVYSYTHPDLVARFHRMRGENVFYPMGFDNNGLPTDRLVEKRLGIRAADVGRQAFTQICLEVSEQAEQDYQALWQRLGLSIDWRYTYRTIDDRSRRTCQWSFIDLYKRGLAYRQEAPAIWCPECQTAIAQAEVNDLERESEFVTLRFTLAPGEGEALPIATTRPELLPACVAVFVHPSDPRFSGLAGRSAVVPLFGQTVPILADPGADPEKGTGAVMCCTFGDTADVAWWRSHKLPLVEAIDHQGRMTARAGDLAGLPVEEARRQVKEALDEAGLLLERQATTQSVRVHERCDTPVEYLTLGQWFIRVLDQRDALLEAGERIAWRPEHMRARYRAWVENLGWDWCISRQRYFGVPFPVWYCLDCGETLLAEQSRLPVDPTVDQPERACSCGSTDFKPETDTFDTWATSSMSPQIVGRWPAGEGRSPTGESSAEPGLFSQVFPFSLRPQGHEIIRTWAFYTIVKSHFHCASIPWKEVLISGWGLAGEGMGKISKSRGGGPVAPMEMIRRYSADALRYWASSTATGKDAIISEEKIQAGARLVTKLWNVARFSERFLEDGMPGDPDSQGDAPAARIDPLALSPADRWILARLQRLIRRATDLLEAYEYAAPKAEIETFFWAELADNYLEMAKQRLYDGADPYHRGAQAALGRVLLVTLKLFAPFLPYVTEEIYQGLFAKKEAGKAHSLHRASWPSPDPGLEDEQAEMTGGLLVEIATAVRRYKSERNLPLGTGLDRLQLAPNPADRAETWQDLKAAESDLRSITRAARVEIVSELDTALEPLRTESGIILGVTPVE